jgi:sterol desaturase/sphingolipid hydroxylase (fatty acid hydroxylase superfamily)
MFDEWLKGLLLTALIFVPLERLFALRAAQRILRPGWSNDLVYLLINGQIIGLALGVLAAGIIMVTGSVMPSWLQAAVAAQPYWVQIIEVVALSDLCFYLAHRAFHEIPWLWKFHAIHHSIEELDWLAAARVHPIDQILTKGFSLLPVFSLGFSDVAIGFYLVLYGWQSVFIHSNLRVRFGPLRWLLASPEFHHWHHGRDREARDKNFAGQLPLIDLAFGTLHMPRGRMPESYGIDETMPTSYLAQLVHPLRGSMWRQAPQREYPDQPGRNRGPERDLHAAVGAPRSEPAELCGERVQQRGNQQDHEKRQGACGAGPEKCNRHQLEIAAAHEALCVAQQHQRKGEGRESEVPVQVDPAPG